MSSAPQILAPNSPIQKPDVRIVGWHFDYQLRCGAIPNGAQTPEIELPIDPGAPFCLRGIGGYNVTAGGPPSTVQELTDAFIQYTDSQDNWLQTTLIGTAGDWPTGGFQAQYEPVYNQLVYGPGSVLSVRLANLSGGNWDDARLVFRGTKLYHANRVYSECYPKCFNQLPWEQVLNINFAANGQLLSIPLIANGAGVALRGFSIAFDNPANAVNLEMRLRDQYEKPYSNDWINFAWLFSQNLANRPGCFYPEFYLPKDRLMLVDANMNDDLELSINLVAMGARIWPK
jgi:hypothetical protein